MDICVPGLYGKKIFSFVNHQTFFKYSCTILHSIQQLMRVPVASEFHLGVILDWPIAIFDSLLGQESLYDHLLKYVRVSLFKTKPFIKNTL